MLSLNLRCPALARISLSLFLSSCSTWPPEGRGGLAEADHTTLHSIENGRDLRPRHGLRLEFEWLKNRLDILILRGARYCLPASVVSAERKENRIAHELNAEFLDDATADIIIQRQQLQKLEHQLEAVLRESNCEPPTNKGGVSLKIHLQSLLNADNQFALNSAELNPKYRARLERAAPLLKAEHTLRLLIVGHTDPRGTRANNLQLSNQRALAVAKHLQTLGIDEDRLNITGVADTQTMYAGSGPETWLVNRTVQIYVTEILQ